ncbi:MAG: TauD/TfdA family dioxygenase [Alphaproteobacteria bacterium]
MNSDIDAVRADFFDRGFVHIRCEEPPSAADLLALATSFGPVLEGERHVRKNHPAIQIISETGLFGDQDLPWHNDFSYGEGDFFGTLLANRKNGAAAATSFVDMATACAALPEAEQERLRSLTGHYFLPADLMSDFYSDGQERSMKRARSARPLVFDHPATGRTVLYFSPGTLRRVRGGEVDIEALIAHCEQFAWDHLWQPNDILLYDNFRVMHRRPPFRGERELWRIQFSPWEASRCRLDREPPLVA